MGSFSCLSFLVQLVNHYLQRKNVRGEYDGDHSAGNILKKKASVYKGKKNSPKAVTALFIISSNGTETEGGFHFQKLRPEHRKNVVRYIHLSSPFSRCSYIFFPVKKATSTLLPCLSRNNHFIYVFFCYEKEFSFFISRRRLPSHHFPGIRICTGKKVKGERKKLKNTWIFFLCNISIVIQKNYSGWGMQWHTEKKTEEGGKKKKYIHFFLLFPFFCC